MYLLHKTKRHDIFQFHVICPRPVSKNYICYHDCFAMCIHMFPGNADLDLSYMPSRDLCAYFILEIQLSFIDTNVQTVNHRASVKYFWTNVLQNYGCPLCNNIPMAWGNFSALAMELLQPCSEPSNLSKILFHWCSISFTCKGALGKQCKCQLYQLYQPADVWSIHVMMVSSNGSIFRVTVHLCGEFTGHRWIPRTKASEAELWCLLWSVPE